MTPLQARQKAVRDMFLAGHTFAQVHDHFYPREDTSFIKRQEGKAHQQRVREREKEQARKKQELAQAIVDLDYALDLGGFATPGKRRFAPGAREAKNAKLSAAAKAQWARRRQAELEQLL